jgi:transcriptional regulator with XRE-family HTH domain
MPKARRDHSNPHPELVRFARTLKRERLAAGLSQQALGSLARVTQSEVSMLEKAHREPRLLTVASLAHALHMKPSELIRDLR